MFSAEVSAPEQIHSHDFIELVYVRDGRATQCVDDATYEVGRGDVLFISLGSRHSFTPHGSFSYVNICFSPDVVADSMITRENAPALLLLTAYEELRGGRGGGVISFHGEGRADIERLIDAMLAEQESAAPYSDRIIESYMSVIVMKMLRRLTEGIAEDGLSSVWRRVEEYIDENYTSRLSLPELAKRSFYNPSYFSRAFRKRFGLSLTDYITKKRVERSRQLLDSGCDSVESICVTCGFSDKSAFYRAFLKYEGISVSDYRKGKDIQR